MLPIRALGLSACVVALCLAAAVGTLEVEAQEATPEGEPVRFHATPYLEVGGRAILGSFNVELQVEMFVLQAGFAPPPDGTDESAKTYSFPLTAGILLFEDLRRPEGDGDHMMEVTGGLTLGTFAKRFFYTGCLGYRYQTSSPWVFRGGLSPIYQPKNRGTESLVFIPWLYGSVGYRL